MGASKREFTDINQNQYLESMKAAVKAVQGNGTFDNDYGTMYKFEYTMSDGVTLSANHKKEGGNFPIGAEVEYEIKGTNKYGSYGSVKKPDAEGFKPSSSGGGGGSKSSPDTQRMIARQSSLKVALDYFHTLGWPEGKEGDLKVLCSTAEYFTNYVLSPPKGSEVKIEVKEVKVAVIAPIASGKGLQEEQLAAAQNSGHLGEPDDFPF